MKELEIHSREALHNLLSKVPILEIKSLKSAPLSKSLDSRLHCRHKHIREIALSGLRGESKWPAQIHQRSHTSASRLCKRAGHRCYTYRSRTLSFARCQTSVSGKKGVGYLDLEGNSWISFDGVFIDHQVTDKPPSENRELKSLFKPKSAQIIRMMLREPDRAWRVMELSEAARASLGQVSNVRTALLNREWARATNEGVCLSDPQSLLDAWVEAYELPSGDRKKSSIPPYMAAHWKNAARNAISERSNGHALFFLIFLPPNGSLPMLESAQITSIRTLKVWKKIGQGITTSSRIKGRKRSDHFTQGRRTSIGHH
ncbi:hypothetical protein ACFS4T_33645 [Pseudomonas lini]